MIKSYWRCQVFFLAVNLSWLVLLLGDGSAGPPVTDDDRFGRNLAYSAGSLVLWLGLLVGGGWLGAQGGFWVGLAVVVVWGFLIAPVVVVLAMRALFPSVSARLQREVDRPGPRGASAD